MEKLCTLFFLTISVSMVSCEIRLSKLKLPKNYLFEIDYIWRRDNNLASLLLEI